MISDERMIAVIRRNDRHRVHVALKTFDNGRAVDLRTYVCESGSTEPVPTFKGLVIRPDMLRALVTALREAEQLLVIEGALNEEQ